MGELSDDWKKANVVLSSKSSKDRCRKLQAMQHDNNSQITKRLIYKNLGKAVRVT